MVKCDIISMKSHGSDFIVTVCGVPHKFTSLRHALAFIIFCRRARGECV